MSNPKWLDKKNNAADQRGRDMVRTLASELKEAGCARLEAERDLLAASAFITVEDILEIIKGVYND